MSKIKIPLKLRQKFISAGRRGGLNGSRAAKVRAGKLAGAIQKQKAQKLTFKRLTLSIPDWAKKLNIPKNTIRQRLARKLPMVKVLSIKLLR